MSVYLLQDENRLSDSQQAELDRLSPHLKAMVLLGGTVRPTAMNATVGRSLLDLPVSDEETVMQCWHAQASALARATNKHPLPVRLLLDGRASRPMVPSDTTQVALSIELDPFEYRGTGGVLFDMVRTMADDDYLLVASAAQVFFEGLDAVAADLAKIKSDVAILAYRNGRPSGAMLIRVGCLRIIPEEGFVDMKEQALPRIAMDHRVGVVMRQRPASLPVRTLADYMSALRRYHRTRAGAPVEANSFAEDWQPTFRIVEAGATVHPTARIHDSVVLRRGKVEAGAVCVRSVIGMDAQVNREQMVVDMLVSGNRRP